MRERSWNIAVVAAALALLLATTLDYHQQAGVNAAIMQSVPRKRAVLKAGIRDSAMVLIPGATFQMGTSASEVPNLQKVFAIKRADLFAAEVPQHPVTINPFYLDRYEVTNSEFKKFIGKNPQWRPDRIPGQYHNGNYLKNWNGNDYAKEKARHPVINVSWYAAVAFCQWVGKRLPTEAEWEYAARGGLTGKAFPWGDEPVDRKRANYSSSEIGETTPVGSYPANGYGLFDMAGNVWEYLADEWGAYPSAPQINPVGGGNLFLDKSFLTITTRRVIRGGSWGGSPVNLRVAYRDSHPPEGARDFVGFRCARSASPKGLQ
jgi:formylglycine-generating enzyme required for sulfatase activity